MKRRPRDGRIHLGGTTVEERIRRAVERDMRELLEFDVDDEPEPAAPQEPNDRELVLGVDVFLMPDGSYALSPAPSIPTPEQQARHLYRMMLTEVMKQQHPLPCQHDARFTADPIPITALNDLQAICDRCPIRSHCRGYANLAEPEAGFWGGRDYTRRTREELRFLARPRQHLRKERAS